MAYDPNALSLVTESPLQGAGQQWQYITSVDNQAAVNTANYFSDAVAKKLLVNDTINYTASDKSWTAKVTVVAAAGATLSTGIQTS
jgi:hypothetical protein